MEKYIKNGLENYGVERFGDLPDDKKDALAENVVKFTEFFEREFGMKAFPFYGSLLGIIRERGFIPHDNDIDMMYFLNERDKTRVLYIIQEVMKRLYKLGVMRYVKPKWMCNGYALGQTMLNFNGMNMDLSVGWDEGRFITWNYCKDMGMARDLFPFRRVPFRKTEILVPKNAELLLNKLYGDWQTPKKEKAGKYQGFKWTLYETALKEKRNENILFKVL